MKDEEELATDLKYNGQQLLLTVITLILTWLMYAFFLRCSRCI